MFKKLDKSRTFPEMEKEVLVLWEKNKTFEKSLEQTKAKKPFVFYDGPPFATGLPHYGHLLAGTLKDIVPRYWTMRGRYVERRFGWDCHGLPIEKLVQDELGLKGTPEILNKGVALFNETCRSSVLKYAGASSTLTMITRPWTAPSWNRSGGFLRKSGKRAGCTRHTGSCPIHGR